MTKDPPESESEGDSDLEDEEIEDQDSGNGSAIDMEGNDRPKIKERVNCGIALYYVTLVHLCPRFELFYRIYSQT